MSGGPRIEPIGCGCGCDLIVAWSPRCCGYVGRNRSERTDAELVLANHVATVHGMTMPIAATADPEPVAVEAPDLFGGAR